MARCRSCNADVVFIRSHKTGKPMILNAAPEKRVVIQDNDGVIARVPADGPAAPEADALVVDTFTPHHATCPAADKWRRSR